MTKARLMLSAALLALPAAALAQPANLTAPASDASTAPPGAQPSTASTTPPQGPANVGQSAASQAQPTGLAEVVVTAQQRGENLQKAAVPVAVVSGSDIINSGTTGVDTLGRLVPSLIVEGSGQGNLIFIRGVGNFSFLASSDPATSFNYDGVYIGRSTSIFGNFYDLERVEVLKGPQGTLYGRNATAGAINVIPVQPRLNSFGGYATASYGNYNTFNVEGAVNAPLGDKAALRVSGTYNRHDGYQNDGTNSDDSGAIRVQLKAELTPDVTVRLEGDYAHQDGSTGDSYVGKYSYSPATGFAVTGSDLPISEGLYTDAAKAFRATGFAGTLPGRHLDPLAYPPYQDNDNYGIGVHVDWKTPIGTVTVLPAWRQAVKDNLDTESGQNVGDHQFSDQYTLEARLVSNPGKIVDYIFGAYYFNELIRDDTHNSTGTLANFLNQRFRTSSPSVYGRLTWHVTDRLRVTGGLRYTEDDKTFIGLTQTLAVVCAVPAACPTAPLLPYTLTLAQQPRVPAASGTVVPEAPGVLIARADTPAAGRLNTNKITYRGAIDFDVTPRNLAYASIETGYRAGGFNTAAPYAPETITAYTLGLKNRFLDNRAQLNLELFDWEYHDQQLTYLGIDALNRLGVITQNVGRSTLRGFEADGRVLVTPATTLSADVQYLDGNYASFIYKTPIRPFSGCIVTPDAPLFTVDCSGKQPFNSPEWTVNLGIQHVIPVGDYQVTLSADTQFRTSRYVGFDYIPQERVGDTFATNAQVSVGPKDGRYVLTAYVRNLENDRIQIYGAPSPASNLIVSLNGAPRLYGVRLSTHF